MSNPEIRPDIEQAARLEKLIPTHIGGELEAETVEGIKERQDKTLSEQLYEKRAEFLSGAPDLESSLRKYLESKGHQVPENLNLSLVAIEEFQRYVREAQDARRIIKGAEDPIERARAFILYSRQKGKLKEYLDQGKSFESAYREYIRNRNEYVEFKTALKKIKVLNNALNEPSFKSVEETAFLSLKEKEQSKEGRKTKKQPVRSYARIEKLMAEQQLDKEGQEDNQTVLDSLASIYSEGSKEYEQLKAEISAAGKSEAEEFKTKKDVADELVRLNERVAELWANPMVRYFTNSSELEGMMEDYHSGAAVLETQSVIKYLNKLNEWEQQHQRTTIGGVLVGPPGVGKTTLVRHYLEAKDRPEYAYIDLSEDVTRYLLYGSKSIEFKNPTEFYTTLSGNLDRLKSEEDIKRFVAENAKTLESVFGVKGDEATVVFLERLQETLAKGTTAEGLPKELAEKAQTTLVKIKGLVEQTFRKELATEFAHVVKRNGWRDGMVIAALRRGESVIFDEFNKNKNWSLIYSLMTAEPGKDWYFADNDEHIKIPEDWRMYFTANIGTRHGGFNIPEALASRAGGKVIEVDYPSRREELLVALTALSNPEGDFLRSSEDLSKLYFLIGEVFPRMRNYLESKKQSIPVSFRTIRDLAEKLVLDRDPKTKTPVYQATNKSFDEALYEVLIDSYALYEDKEPPKEWVSTLTSVGLLLDDKVKDKVIKWIGEAEYEERRKNYESKKEDYNQVVAKIKGMTRSMGADMAIPDQTNF